MQTLDIEELRNDPSRLDRAARKSPDVDRFCSSSAWSLSAHETFHPDSTPRILASGEGLVALTELAAESGRYLAPLEAMWGLASPILGPDPVRIAQEFCDWLLENPSEWQHLWFSGLRLGSPVLITLVEHLGDHFPLGGCPGTASCISSLAGGLDGFLGRRSPRFRQNLRRLRRRNEHASIWYEPVHPTTENDRQHLFERILAIETKSWKGQQGEGIDTDPMRSFYESVTRRLTQNGLLRTFFARHGDTDCGYIFGGLLDQEYRGLQMSYLEGYRELGVGNILQLQMIEALCEEGITRYDLGMAIDYKRHWSDEIQESVCLALLRPE